MENLDQNTQSMILGFLFFLLILGIFITSSQCKEFIKNTQKKELEDLKKWRSRQQKQYEVERFNRRQHK